MDGKEVIWSIRAKNEFQEILDFYIQRNQSANYSQNLLAESEKVINLLKENPYLGRLTNNTITRVIVKDDFLIFYEIGKTNIEIVSYWDNRQNPNDRIDSKYR